MVDVFQEARRVLRKDGTCWINMGDSYAGSPGGFQAREGDGRKLMRDVGIGPNARPSKAVPNRPKASTGVGFGHGFDEHPKPRVKDADTSERLGRGPGWRVKNNESFHAAMSVMQITRNKRSVWTMSTEAFPGAHFATFPGELARICILAGCPPGGTVLDMFAGACTTGLVAERFQRHSILIEIAPHYAEMGAQRIMADAPLLTTVDTRAAI